MMAQISEKTISSLKERVDAATSEEDGIPGVVYCAVNKNGDLIFEHASGKVGAGKKEPMTMDSVLWIASCTKLITSIACMQLVEQGKLGLDDVDLVEKLAPELKAVKVYDNGKLVDKERGITLRMLMAHTAGFGYSFFDQRLIDYYGARGVDEFNGSKYDYISQPLVNQPGKTWEYGINLDWAGELVSRVTGMSLNDYFQEHIFKPMGIKNINMFPTDDMLENLAFMNTRDPQGKITLRLDGHVNKRPLGVQTQQQVEDTFNSGGAGCFAKPAEYCQIIATLLNDGKHPKSGNQILKPETVSEMFTNQIPTMPNFGRQGFDPPKRDLANPVPELYPQQDNPPQGWGLSFFLHSQPGPTGRSGSTAWWTGLPNLYWWADRENGLGGIIASQILPFGDMKVLGLWGEVEAGLYQAIKK